MGGGQAGVSLFWRIFLLNAVVVVVAAGVVMLAPVTVSTQVTVTEAVIIAGGVVVMLAVNAVLLRAGLAPLRRLTRAMTTTDLLRPGPRPTVTGHGGIAELIETFNSMLDRLQAERGQSSARALSAQEAERHRIAQELHDEIGQTLTAVLLELKRVADHAPGPVRDEILQVQETTRGSLDELRRIARRLRPGVLEELGLVSALKALTVEIFGPTEVVVRREFARDLPSLGQAAELVVYRVAQESLTNTARHARAGHVDLALTRSGTGVRLRITDDGCGLGAATEGAGIQGMRERALLIGAKVTVGPGPRGGTEVALDVPRGTDD